MIPWAKPNYYGYEKKYINQALQSTWLSEGKFVKDLENKLRDFISILINRSLGRISRTSFNKGI